MKILTAFGKHQYGDPARGESTEFAAFLPALKNLGHEVVHFELWNKSKYLNYADLNDKLIRTILREKPDILFAIPLHYEIWLETLQLIRRYTKTRTICWTTDDSWKYREVSRFIGKSYHLITTTYADKLPLYRKDGIHHVHLSQWAANSMQMQAPLAAKDCIYEVTFIGEAHGDRKKRIDALRQKGLNVKCFGHGWPAGPIPAESIPEIMRKSIISLNFANSKGKRQIKARTFEVPGAGGFLLSEAVDTIEHYYQVGNEIDCFGSIDELVQKIRYYLSHLEERDRIAFRGYLRTKSDHTYEKRFEKILKAVKLDPHNGNDPEPINLMEAFQEIKQRHCLTRSMEIARCGLVHPAMWIWGKRRGVRAARRLTYEISWRILREGTYTAAGLPGRLFPEI